ncbi:MAG: PPOX class F420-dependent oxidoreductase [Acidimicrobiales bacterium]
MTELAQTKYVAFTTNRKDGTPVSVPVWIVDLGDDTVGFTTGSDSYKVKRIRRDQRVSLQASNARGVPVEGSPVFTGTAEVITGARYQTVREKLAAKYGMQSRLIGAAGKVRSLFGGGPAADCAVEVRLDRTA